MPSTTATSHDQTGSVPALRVSEPPVSEGALPPKPRRRVSGLADAAAGAVPHGIVRTRTVPTNTTRALRRLRDEAGAATAEYVIATMAAVGFAGLLILILRGDEVRGILTELVRHALTVG
ncbi:DUF4244 domain-containing protein [Cryobacterium sp. RTS3]|jgi:Flp pilus assembly pilin Flp|uniref:DUF4244 domain-containing protein n=1 Tax=Cryobacterium sp. RTS3 TaxID=3048643 RepID=UPI002B23DEFA|nr:DUF4244 domain-containing protein [Cryobacterium sp. RTS3]MEB0000582.1 DUF4244 domain-containing protein [Cryobacterium sp. RTS3]